ncbi:MAG: tRNA uridine-5-carboxymethylaminomethyl(34) synthesis GTPase MnmE [Pyrinomonadaceae bacterium]|nr:tRNA uridine-5-carboxymethylaminomethyl(34) synthesis GTPase MnmE [Pyrinomonadaceae bacterium]
MDTIVALATPLGRSGIGVIRLSGEDALKIAGELTGEENFDPNPREANLRKLTDPDSNELIDEALITYFKSPNSFTGEDVVEISCHGSPVLLRQVIDICLKLDARLADPGEFTLRALANGQLDLSQAEAIRDLIDANSVAMTRQAIRQLRGEFSHTLQPLKDELLNVIVVLESALEFVEDDLPDVQTKNIRDKLTEIASKLGKLTQTFQAGKLIREGIRVALVGRPNVGKSSLFNALIGQDRAIVTEIPGTTRDQLHESFTLNNIPVSLIDTAGLRETIDTVESIGVERAKRAMNDADLVVVLLDIADRFTTEDEEILNATDDLNRIIALNKNDLDPSNGIRSKIENRKSKVINISAKTGEGLDALQKSIIEPFSPDQVESSGFLVSDARHNDLLLRSKAEIETSIDQMDQKLSEEIVLIGLHNAIRYLGEITGETTTEDMLTRIFSTFCIGK